MSNDTQTDSCRCQTSVGRRPASQTELPATIQTLEDLLDGDQVQNVGVYLSAVRGDELSAEESFTHVTPPVHVVIATATLFH